jgi:predicted AAA+ superfamily ATPase
MIRRASTLSGLNNALARSRFVLLVGPRQSGKTKLARERLQEDSVNYFDLEDPARLARPKEPMTALRLLKGLAVIDEIQRRPDLFPELRVLADPQWAESRSNLNRIF